MLTAAQRLAVETLVRDVGQGVIAPYFRNLKQDQVRFKSSPADPVSVADEEAERRLRAGLLEILPGSLFIGEESYAADPGLIVHLNQSERPVWVVDPLDGTSNFVAGREGFGVILALVHRHQVLSGWLYEICTDTMTSAHRGEGIRINGEIWQDRRPSRAWIHGQIGRKIYRLPVVKATLAAHPEVKLIAEGIPSILCYTGLLSGRFDFLVYQQHSPWDHLPGFALLQESGGVYERWDRTPFQFTDFGGGLVAARSPEVMERVQTLLISPLCGFPEVMNIGRV